MKNTRADATEIGAYEAKTRLPELLRAVQAGKRFTITHRGQAIADLVPSAAAAPVDARRAIEKFQEFIRTHPAKTGIAVRELIEEGRQ
jgi:prevent-host-death family protein